MRRPVILGLVAGGILFVVLLVVAVVVTVTAVDRARARDDVAAAAAQLQDAVDTSGSSIAAADDVLALGADPLLPAEPMAGVSTERDAAAGALEEAETLLAVDPDGLGTDDLVELRDDLRETLRDLDGDDDLVLAALRDVVTATQSSSADVDATNFSAENLPRLDFRAAVAELDAPTDDEIALALGDYLAAAHALEASHAEEIAEKSGPLLDLRLAVEEFARSIAGGVLLEFDWAVTVNGYGTGGSYGGTSYWQSADGGYATITLSDSVATLWPGAGVQSLVAHEVGHAILSTCTDLYFGSEYDQGNEESWATAWAIGMGYTADGSGESIYGRPSQGLIDLSTQCR